MSAALVEKVAAQFGHTLASLGNLYPISSEALSGSFFFLPRDKSDTWKSIKIVDNILFNQWERRYQEYLPET